MIVLTLRNELRLKFCFMVLVLVLGLTVRLSNMALPANIVQHGDHFSDDAGGGGGEAGNG